MEAMSRSNRSQRAAAGDRAIRSLMNLQANASTARTLNLIEVWRKHGDNEKEYVAKPFFRNPTLNRSIIVKHRLRPNEQDVFHDGRTGATKVILPIDLLDLRSGARSFFIGQVGYQDVLEDLFGRKAPARGDDQLLDILDSLPSLDPFLMRERLRKSGFAPGRCYFDITDADTQRMFDFVRKEVTPLIGISFDDLRAEINEKTSKLAAKILANASDAELEPLRQGMGIDRAAFDEGMFCWKGFIYYKWTLSALLPQVRPISAEIAAIRPHGPTSDEDRAYILAARTRMSRAIALACETVRSTLKIYDDAYADLTRNGQPNAFREFLLKAPTLFYELGERLGAVQHIVSFWRFRFPAGSRFQVGPEELVDLLADFEFSLSFDAMKAAA
jgi:hypothetical protein